MYEERFGFSGSPFRLAPDPKFFFGTKSHNKAMSYLHYGLRQAEGFIVITGEIGAGKSILIGRLLDQLDRSNVVAATLATPNVPAADLLSHILSAFRIEPANAGATAEIEAFEDFLFDQMNHGRRVLLIVDEAQNLPLATLEELRVLSNLDYEGTPLFQVFLVGQPDFRDVLARADMEQLRQRVIAAYHLEPMTGSARRRQRLGGARRHERRTGRRRARAGRGRRQRFGRRRGRDCCRGAETRLCEKRCCRAAARDRNGAGRRRGKADGSATTLKAGGGARRDRGCVAGCAVDCRKRF